MLQHARISPCTRQFGEALGPQASEDLVTILDEIRADADRTRTELRALGTEMGRFQADMTAQFQGVHNSMIERFAAVEVKLADVKADLMKWSFVFWCDAVAAIAALAGVLDR